MKKRVYPAGTSSQLDREIGALVALESEAGIRSVDTGAGAMTPMEAAVTDLTKDMRNLLRLAGQLRDQGDALESFARLMLTDMEKVTTAVQECVSQTLGRTEE